MAQIAVAPIVLKNVVVTFGTDSYEKHVSEVTFTPSNSIQTWQGGTPDASFTDVGPSTWTATVAFAQDWDTDDSLSLFLFENEGETVELTFKPSGSSGTWNADVVAVPGAVGGAIGSFATGSVTLPIQGRPTFTPAA